MSGGMCSSSAAGRQPSGLYPDLLAAILAATRRSIEVRREREPFEALERRASEMAPRPGLFEEALSRADRLNVIAECKRRSPSRGVLRPDYDPSSIARGYEAAGAAAISVLTEPTFFDGSLAHLRSVREAVGLPLLCKDFILDEYQLYEARAAGADAVLLIVAAVGPGLLARLAARASALGLAHLVEVHDRGEVSAALDAGAKVIGVNNRNLRTLSVNEAISMELIDAVPDRVVRVSESGLRTGEDLRKLRIAGYDAFLMGERLMSAGQPGAALAEVLRGAQS